MCYSATASFTAAGILAIGAGALIAKNRNRRFFAMTLIPLFFAVQQLAEGFVWQDMSSQFWKTVYLFFAMMFWPVYIPFSIYRADRCKWQLLFIGMGITLALILGAGLPAVAPQQMNHSIQYDGPILSIHSLYYPTLYLFITVIPTWISPIRKMRLFGLLSLIAAILVFILDRAVFLSLWCFLEALICLSLFFIIPKKNYNKN